MTGNAHKESCHKLLLILVREKRLYIIKTDCSGEIVVAFTIKEKISYWLAYFLMWCCCFPIHICGIKLLICCAIGLVSGIATKAAIVLFIFSFTNCCGYNLC